MARGKKAEEESVVLEAAPKSKRLTTTEQFKRNVEIVADKCRGEQWAVIAERHNISVKQARRVFAAYREQADTILETDPVEVVRELLEGYLADIADCTQVYRDAIGDNNINGRIGAINARMAARQKATELRQAVGNLPRDLGTLRLEIDAQITVDRVIKVLERFDLPEQAWDELLTELGGPPEGFELPVASSN